MPCKLQSLINRSQFDAHSAFAGGSRDLSGEPPLRRAFFRNLESLPWHRGLVQSIGQPSLPEQARILPLPAPAPASSISSQGALPQDLAQP